MIYEFWFSEKRDDITDLRLRSFMFHKCCASTTIYITLSNCLFDWLLFFVLEVHIIDRLWYDEKIIEYVFVKEKNISIRFYWDIKLIRYVSFFFVIYHLNYITKFIHKRIIFHPKTDENLTYSFYPSSGKNCLIYEVVFSCSVCQEFREKTRSPIWCAGSVFLVKFASIDIIWDSTLLSICLERKRSKDAWCVCVISRHRFDPVQSTLQQVVSVLEIRGRVPTWSVEDCSLRGNYCHQRCRAWRSEATVSFFSFHVISSITQDCKHVIELMLYCCHSCKNLVVHTSSYRE